MAAKFMFMPDWAGLIYRGDQAVTVENVVFSERWREAFQVTFNPDKYTVHELLRAVQFSTMEFEEAEEFLIKKLALEYERGVEDGRKNSLDTSHQA